MDGWPAPDDVVVPVLGMHRSGTSMFTRALNLAGMELGEPLLGPKPDNPRGFWENIPLVSVDMQLLQGLGKQDSGFELSSILLDVPRQSAGISLQAESKGQIVQYLNQTFSAGCWGWKDPRSVLLYPFWIRLLREQGYRAFRPAIVVRHPHATVRSLLKRGDLAPVAARLGVGVEWLALDIWKAYNQILLAIAEEMDCFVSAHEWLLDRGRAGDELERCIDYIGLGKDRLDAAIGWIDPSLVHHRSEGELVDEPALELYARFVEIGEEQRDRWKGSSEVHEVESDGGAEAPEEVLLRIAEEVGQIRFYQDAYAAARTQMEAWGLAGASDAGEKVEGEIAPGQIPQGGDPTLSVVIVAGDEAEDLANCIGAVRQHTGLPVEIAVVVSQPPPAVRQQLEQCQREGQIASVVAAEPGAVTAAVNRAAGAMDGAFVALLKGDTVVSRQWGKRLLAHFDEGVGVVGPVANNISGKQRFEGYLRGEVEQSINIHDLADRLFEWNRGSHLSAKSLDPACLVIARTAVERFGLFDEELPLASAALEYALRLRRQGGRLLVATDTFVYSKGGAPGGREEQGQERLYEKLRAIYGGEVIPSGRELWDIDWFRPAQLQQAELTSIIILTFNQLDYTKQCLASIETHTPQDHEIILIDNGSTDGTVDYLRDFAADRPAVTLILNEENRGFAGGNNQGIEKARGDYILLLNNDVVVTQGWLERMLAPLQQDPEVGIVGPTSNFVSGPQLVKNVPYEEDLEQMHEFAAAIGQVHRGKTTGVIRLVGFCLLIRRRVLETVGGLDETYGSGNYEDDDLCLRSFIAGYKHLIAHDAFVHHFGSVSFSGNSIDYNSSMQTNRALFEEKWKHLLEFSGNSYRLTMKRREQIQELLDWGEEAFGKGEGDRAIRLFTRVLDLSPGNPTALNDLGVIQYQLGNNPEAIDLFVQALTVNAADGDALFNLVSALVDKGGVELLPDGLLPRIKAAQPENEAVGIMEEMVGELTAGENRERWSAPAVAGSRDAPVDDMRVDFVIGGVQKGGTSALYYYLTEHPDVFLPPVKEIHFFDEERHFRNGQSNYELYHSCFEARQGQRLLGDATPIYMYWYGAPGRVWDYNPGMKWILILRNPIERAFSHWNMERSRQLESLTFTEAIEREADRCREALPFQHKIYSYVDRGFYTEQIRRIWHFFPREQTLILKNEELRREAEPTLERVCRFLEIDPPAAVVPREVHARSYSSEMAEDERQLLERIYEFEIRQLERLLDWDCSDWL